MNKAEFTINEGTVRELRVLSFPLKPRMAMRLDKRITTLILSAIGVEGLDLDNTDASTLFSGFSEALNSLKDEEFLDLVIGIFSTSQIIKNNKAFNITNGEEFDQAFRGHPPIDVYKIMIKIMQENCFTPFELAEQIGIDLKEIIKDIGSQT